MFNLFRNLSLKNKIGIPFFVFLVLVIIQSMISCNFLTKLNDDIKRQDEVIALSLKLVLEADKDLYQAQVSERALILATKIALKKDKIDSLIYKRKKDLGQATSRFSKAITTLGEAKYTANLNNFNEMLLKWVALTNSAIALAQTGEIEEAIKISIGEADDVLAIALDNLEFIAEELIQRSYQNKTDIRTNVNNAIFIQVALAATFIIFMVFLHKTVTTDL